MTDLLLINAHLDGGKYAGTLAGLNRRFNYGILSIGSHATQAGYTVEIFDAEAFQTHEDAVAKTVECCTSSAPRVIGISCISGFGYPFTKAVSARIGAVLPNSLLITGGQDYIGYKAATVLRDCPSIDACVTGEGEVPIVDILALVSPITDLANVPGVVTRRCLTDARIRLPESYLEYDQLAPTRYSLYPDIDRLPAGIDVSRGCPHECLYCQTGRTPYRKRPASEIAEAIDDLGAIQGSLDPRLYLEGPLFTPNSSELKHLQDHRRSRSRHFTWRAQTRVEHLTKAKLSEIFLAGGRVLDVGIESASPRILCLMKKTKDPKGYLAKTERLLRDAYECGVRIKVNLMYYPGDTLESLRESCGFLLTNRKYITSISAYPFLYFPDQDPNGQILATLSDHGGAVRHESPWTQRGVFPVDTSAECRYEFLCELAVTTGKALQSRRDYYQEKRYGYFSPHLTYTKYLDAWSTADWRWTPVAAGRADQEAAFSRLLKFVVSGQWESLR